MAGEAYFKALCAAEAGEWIFRTVENVESVVQLRSFPKYSPGGLGSLIVSEKIGSLPVKSLLVPPAYKFVEIPEIRERADLPSGIFIRYVPASRITPIRTEYETAEAERYATARSRYGLVQRGINRRDDIEHGIRGAELLIVDRQKNEVLGMSRDFLRYTFKQASSNSLTIHGCERPGHEKFLAFAKSVLKPIQTKLEGK